MKVLFCEEGFIYARKVLKSLLPELEILSCPRERIMEYLRDVDVIVPAMTRITQEVIYACNSLKLIQQWGVGLEGVDIDAATRRGVYVANVPSAGTGNAESVAELAIFFMIALGREFNQCQISIKEKRIGTPVGSALINKTVGIVGLGNIGREIIYRLKPFNVKILGITKNPSEERRKELGISFCGSPSDLHKILPEVDYLILCCMMSPETKGMIGERELSIIKRGSFIINVARGGVVDKNGLLTALREGRIAGAGLDVFWEEPIDPDDELFKYNVITTPHIGGVTRESYVGIGKIVAENIRRVEMGIAPLYCVNLKN